MFTYKLQEGACDKIKRQIADICISLKAKDYLTLPDKIIDDRFVQLDKKAKKAYDDFEREMVLKLDNEEEIDVTAAAGLTNKLLQFCNGAVYKEDGSYITTHNSKIEMLMEMLEELNGQPVLIFYNFRSDLERIQDAVKKLKLRVGILKDAKDIEKWNAGELDVLLAHPASAAYGLNLQDGGNHIIWFGLNWSLELYQQANARLYRQGQKNTVFIHRLITKDCMDEMVLDSLHSKNDFQENLLKLLKARVMQIKGGAK